MKTYVIYTNEAIKLVMSTDSISQLEANIKTGDKYKEVDRCFSIGRHKVLNGELVEKTLDELKETIIF